MVKHLPAPSLLPSDPPEMRRRMDELMSSTPPSPDVTLRSDSLGQVPVLRITPPHGTDTATLLYFHGGAYLAGRPHHTAALAARIAEQVGGTAVSVDYRLAPEDPFPAALDDAVAAYRGLLEAAVLPGTIVVAGDSAGGGLALALLVAIRSAALPQPASAAAMSPWTDLSLSGDSMTTKSGVDPIVSRDAMRGPTAAYLGGADARDPLASPLFADLQGLPPLLVQVGSHEVLLDDALRFAARAATADVDVTLEVVPGMTHVFQNRFRELPEASAAIDRIGQFFRRHLG